MGFDKWVSILSFAELHHTGRDKQSWKENANTARLDSTSFEVSQDFSKVTRLYSSNLENRIFISSLPSGGCDIKEGRRGHGEWTELKWKR